MATARQRQHERGDAAERSRRERALRAPRTGWLTWVDGYWRADGVWVGGYYRAAPRHLAGHVATGAPASLSSR
ncbi:MAG: hypothetical protein KF782_19000 [Labilithrix sp.]|nr:hypothetical protein [Labilithrix sp.]